MLDRRRSEYGQEAFFELLLPLLPCLEAHARRELDRLVSESKIGRGEVTVADLTHDVLVRAWEDFDSRPQTWPLDAWLTDLLDNIVRRIESEPRRISMDLSLAGM
jgi:DNA-directed RNA polymerase specialized sigma24 family protein